MLGIYKKKISDNEFLFLPKEPCPYVDRQGLIRCRSSDFYPDMTPVVIEGYMKEKFYYVEKISYPSSDRREASFFLNCLEKKLPDKTKENMLLVMGNDVIRFAERKDAEKILSEKLPKISATVISELLMKVRRISGQKKLLDLLKTKGIEEEVIEKIVNSNLSYEQLRINPFRTWYGIDPFSAEKIAEKVRPYTKARLQGFITYAIDSFISTGDTCVTFKGLYKRLSYLLKRSAFPEEVIPVSVIYSVIKDMSRYLTIDTINGEAYIYKTKILQQEQKVAQHVVRLCENKTTVVHDVDIEKIEEINGFLYNEGQKAVFPAIKTSGIKIITGPPGSGKTAIIKGLLLAYKAENHNSVIELSATTGAAAQVIKKACGENGQTVHKLLNLRPCGDTILCKSEGDPINAGLIIVDEVSMLDLETASYLFAAVKNGTILILCGDDNQLESVGYGKVLADLIDCGKVEVYRLYQIMRQSGTICENASAILKGITNIKTDKTFSLSHYSSDEEAVEAMMQNLIYRQSFVLSPIKNKDVSGVYALNKKIQGSVSDLSYCFSHNKERYHIGDRIIMTQTNYEQGYFNGDIGTISSYCDGIATVIFFDKILTLSRDDFSNMQLAYSITVHKSQGSEIEDVHIVLPDSCKNMLTRRIVYTAITRAKSHVYIYSVGNAFEYAVKNKAEHQRQSNLVYRITGDR